MILLLCSTQLAADNADVTTIELHAKLLRSYDAAEADQGVAVDAEYFYAIDNRRIGKYRKSDGTRVAAWQGAADGPLQHINSCYAHDDLLHCAHSNYPDEPMASSIELFSTASLKPMGNHSLGTLFAGSLTWTQPLAEGLLACFVNYDHRPPEYRDHRYSSVVWLNPQWQAQASWTFPSALLQRMAPYAASGGVIGDDGLLYVMGHDLPELYVLARPVMGSQLQHLATIKIAAAGQAFAWDYSSQRNIYSVDRKQQKVNVFALPRVNIPSSGALPFKLR